MAVIKVNCNDMYQRAKQIRNNSQKIHELLSDVYLAFGDIQSIWKGNSYNELVNQVNTMTTPLNKMLKIMSSNIPYTIEKVAYNYAVADEQGAKVVKPVKGENLKKINSINVPQVEQLTFLSTEVELFKNLVLQKLNRVNDLINNVESLYRDMSWQGKAAKEFNSKVSNLKKYMFTTVNDLKNYIEQYIQKAQEEMQYAENQNKV